jgi:hypothetical protein
MKKQKQKQKSKFKSKLPELPESGWKIVVKKSVHPMWEQEQLLKKNKKFIKSLKASGYPKGKIAETLFHFGREYYEYTLNETNPAKDMLNKIKGFPEFRITMIHIRTFNKFEWEIYARDDKRLFEDVLRFKTWKEADKKTRKYLIDAYKKGTKEAKA